MDGHGRASYIPPERRQGFDYWKVLECTHDYQNSEYYDSDDPDIKIWPGYDAFAQTDDACVYINEHSKKPFFLFLSLGPPHFPHHNAPKEFQEMFSPEAITFSPNVVFEDSELEAFTRQEAAGYYAHIAALDQCVGGSGWGAKGKRFRKKYHSHFYLRSRRYVGFSQQEAIYETNLLGRILPRTLSVALSCIHF